jgi:hypothetical protein
MGNGHWPCRTAPAGADKHRWLDRRRHGHIPHARFTRKPRASHRSRSHLKRVLPGRPGPRRPPHGRRLFDIPPPRLQKRSNSLATRASHPPLASFTSSLAGNVHLYLFAHAGSAAHRKTAGTMHTSTQLQYENSVQYESSIYIA